MKFLVDPVSLSTNGGCECYGAGCNCNTLIICDCYQAGYCGTFDPCSDYLCTAYSTRSV